uniref:Homologous recombination OB-fold protein OB-fold domain-containing protein n=1 Tax=Periophthalmus magnuspinnatus TaxID=409849 RepID=A0A3B4AMC9_9GOBI
MNSLFSIGEDFDDEVSVSTCFLRLSNHNIQKITLPSGISKLSRFAFSANQAPPGSTSECPSAASSIPYPSTTILSPHPQSVVPQSPGVFPGLTAASPCLRRGPEQMRQPLSTPVSSKHNRGLFESISPAAPPRPLTPSSLHTPVLTNQHGFPGPAGLLPQQVCIKIMHNLSRDGSQTEEEDFSGPAWTSMKTEMGLDERNPSCFLHTYSVVMVLRKVRSAFPTGESIVIIRVNAALKQLVKNKVPNMAVLLKSLVPTHTDAKAVFKDPTGEMQGTVHRRLLEDRAGDLKPGAVLLLKQVGVFSPSHRNHYLNVTPNNLLRVYSPDGACMSCTQLPPLAMVSTKNKTCTEDFGLLSEFHL